MTIREYIVGNWNTLKSMQHQDRLMCIMDATGASWDRVVRIHKQVSSGIADETPRPTESGITREELMAKHDTATKTRLAIREGVKTLTDDDDILTNAQFAMRCRGSTPAVFRTIAGESEFVKYQFKVGDTVYWSTPATKKWAMQTITKVQDI